MSVSVSVENRRFRRLSPTRKRVGRTTRNYFSLGFEEEARLMRSAEYNQTQIDRFWGLDKEAEEMDAERLVMRKEDDRSLLHEQFCKKLEFHQRWEDELRQSQSAQAFTRALEQINERRTYMDTLFNAVRSDDVLRFQPKSSVSVLSNAAATAPAGPNSSGNQMLLNASDFAQFSFHLDGFQQLRGLAIGRSVSIESPLRCRTSTSVVNAAIQYNHRQSQNGSSSSSSPAKINQVPIGAILKPPLDDLKRLRKAVHRHHMEKVDGHPIFRWDQELILTRIFQRLCGNNSTVPSTASMSYFNFARLSHDLEIRDLLKYTFFSAWLKQKDWHRFNQLFLKLDENVVVDDNAISLVLLQHNSSLFLSLEEWIEGARKASLMSNIPMTSIRTNDEHMDIAGGPAAGQQLQDLLGEDTDIAARVFASQARQSLFRIERVARLRRSLSEGDLVWAQSGQGVHWMPAVVTQMPSLDGDPDDVSLAFVMTQEEFNDAKRQSSRNQILGRQRVLASTEEQQQQQDTTTTDSTLLAAPPSPANYRAVSSMMSEPEVIGFVFDSLDVGGKGVISYDQLRVLRNPLAGPWRELVKCSAALSSIFGSAAECEPMFNVLLSTLAGEDEAATGSRSRSSEHSFFGQQNQAAAGGGVGLVRRDCFIESCIALLEMKVFNSYGPQ